MSDAVHRRCLAGTAGGVLIVTAATKDPAQSEQEWDAENPDESWSAWKAGMAETFRRAGASSVDFIDEKDAARARAQIEQADALWFSGGDQNNITKAYPPSLPEHETAPRPLAGHSLHETMLSRHSGGTSVCGTSAGAAMAGDLMFTGDSLDGAPIMADGMGFLTGITPDSHFTQRLRLIRLLAALRAHVGQVGIGINEDSAVEFDGDRVSILEGSAQFLRILGPGEDDYLSLDMIQGERYRLPDGDRVPPALAGASRGGPAIELPLSTRLQESADRIAASLLRY